MLCLPKLQEMKSRPLEVEMKLNEWQPAVGGGGWERGRAHNLIALHLSLEVPPVELEVTGKVQEIFCLRQFLGSWWDEMLLYLLLRPPLSADLEIMTRLTTSPLCSSPPPLLLCSLVSLFLRQQRRIIHHYKQLLRSRSGPSPNPTSALKIFNIIQCTIFSYMPGLITVWIVPVFCW